MVELYLEEGRRPVDDGIGQDDHGDARDDGRCRGSADSTSVIAGL